MTLKSVRRPHSLIAQAQENLRSSQIAHRHHHLQHAAVSKADIGGLFGGASVASGSASCLAGSGHRPPQLPNDGYPSRAGLSAVELPGLVANTAQRCLSRTVTASSSDSRPSSKQRRRTPSEVRSPRRSPSSASARSSRASPRTPIAAALDKSAGLGAARAPDDDDDTFEADLADLEALSNHLDLRVEDVPSSSVIADARPTTGGTQASSSTTAPGGSLSGDVSTFTDTEEAFGSEALHGGVEEIGNPLRGAHRAQFELQRCKLPPGCRIEHLTGSPGQFFYVVDVAEGPYTPATMTFWIKVFDDFPAPDSLSVRSTKRIFHPSIDPITGHVGIPWSRSSTAGDVVHIQSVLCAVRQLAIAPEDAPAINAEAAMLLQTDLDEFRRAVRTTVSGGDYAGSTFDSLLNPSSLGSKHRNIRASTASTRDGGRGVSDEVKLGLMQLELMKDKFKQQATDWQQQNSDELRSLE